ncbi:hypothetical protein [Microbulbifer sp. ARAS458-1]|uniref:hypothetical protein n=1 Tax=Microbulbifer sp. ARAS458-1 TaxID=3140242 RepID=UPI0038782C87
MSKIAQENLTKIVNQIDKTIDDLAKKESQSNDEYVRKMLKKYLRAKSDLSLKGCDVDIVNLKKLLNGARGYMERSSDYSQRFLHEMGEAERLIKSL